MTKENVEACLKETFDFDKGASNVATDLGKEESGGAAE